MIKRAAGNQCKLVGERLWREAREKINNSRKDKLIYFAAKKVPDNLKTVKGIASNGNSPRKVDTLTN